MAKERNVVAEIDAFMVTWQALSEEEKIKASKALLEACSLASVTVLQAIEGFKKLGEQFAKVAPDLKAMNERLGKVRFPPLTRAEEELSEDRYDWMCHHAKDKD
jgi:hypothetical protein